MEPARQMSRLPEHPRVQYICCDNLHAADVLSQIEQFEPDLGICLAAPILRPPLFQLPKSGTINLHKGRVPEYRGMPPAFWEMWNQESEVGCTVHWVDAGLDTGQILVASTVPITKFSTVKGLQLQLDELGIRLVNRAIRLIADGNPSSEKQRGEGRTYTTPTLRQQRELDRRSASHKGQNVLKRQVKEAVFFSYSNLIRPIPSRVLAWQNRQRVVVLLYHRVNDELRDTVTVGIEQFDRQMELVRRKYTVATIDDVVAGRVPRNIRRPVVAVTFDDGYLDNYQNAVPILVKHGIPAAFFVSTGMIGAERGFPHDLTKLGRPLPNMTWDHLAEMKQLGFTIGSHTVSHVNCAQAPPEEVRAELVASKAELQSRLGLEEVLFAYPFGKKSDITPEILEDVKRIGYASCLSAYGGCNRADIDPFDVRRMGIDYNFSDRAFQARLEGYGG